MDIEKGFCHCGCGERTKIAEKTSRTIGWIKGEPVKWVLGHHKKGISPPNKGVARSEETRKKISENFYAKHGNGSRVQEPVEPKLCGCGCGELTPIATRAYLGRGIRKGEYMRYLPTHHLKTQEHKDLLLTFNKGAVRSIEQKIKAVRTRTGRDAIFSPYVPNLVIHFDKRKQRWVGNSIYKNKNGELNQKTHARIVWEYNYGPCPEEVHVHHVNGRCDRLEDDAPENLIILSKDWNSIHMVSLSRGFGIPESSVTMVYRDVVTKTPMADVYRAVCQELLNLTK